MLRIVISCAFLICLPNLYGQKPGDKFSFSANFLIAKDVSLQSPDNGSTSRQSFGITPGFEGNFEVRMRKNLWFSTGYRYKDLWGTTSTFAGKESRLLAQTHSIPLKLAWKKDFINSNLLQRFSLVANAGLLLSYVDGNTRFKTKNEDYPGTVYYSGGTFWKSPSNDEQKMAGALDGMLKLNYRLWNNLNLNAGYGYSYGLSTLVNGQYHISASEVPTASGTMKTRGSYHYMVMGFSMLF